MNFLEQTGSLHTWGKGHCCNNLMRKGLCFFSLICFLLFVVSDLSSSEKGTASSEKDLDTMVLLEEMCKGYDKKFSEIKHVSVASYLKLPDKRVLVDVRSVKERQISMIPNAITIDMVEKDQDYYKNKKLLIYCTVGERSSQYVKKLLSRGFANVANLRGGVLKWAGSGEAFASSNGKRTRDVNVYGATWDLLPEGYTGIW